MEIFKTEIRSAILEPKKEILMDGLTAVLNGMEKSYIPNVSEPKYYEIWFYQSFDFKYIILGFENFIVDVSEKTDSKLLTEIIQKHNFSGESNEEQINMILKKTEFEFFSECWTEIENTLGKKIRCFLVEHGILRGWDVNKMELIDGENIDEILNDEGLANNY